MPTYTVSIKFVHGKTMLMDVVVWEATDAIIVAMKAVKKMNPLPLVEAVSVNIKPEG